MGTDIHNWEPITLSETERIFSVLPVKWMIAGGWALDLHAGKQSRPHGDIDIVLFREEHVAAFDLLSAECELYKAEKGKLSRWRQGEYLSATKDIWARRIGGSSWAFQMMLVDTEQGDWVYRRETAIRRAAAEILVRTKEGIPYLRPEIQLLYKGGSSDIREKDEQDLQRMLPLLSEDEKQWLTSALIAQFPRGHRWVDAIRQTYSVCRTAIDNVEGTR
ncbi:nucleotidyltransferase domain-containing protein [Paenibacillus sp. YIM B09110]|uniref:nucleotidyltransferase domain-containing protein n=1 Tax=Paenibacillus sp. YIM B09110 TaxID=3126102 RepID=UPI00301D135A